MDALKLNSAARLDTPPAQEQDAVKKVSLAGGLVAALLASVCCLGPLVLVTLGVSGAWISNLTLMEPYKPLFIGVAVVFMALAWRKIYRPPPTAACTPGTLCALPQTNRVYRLMFWIVAALIVLALAFPYFAPLFY